MGKPTFLKFPVQIVCIDVNTYQTLLIMIGNRCFSTKIGIKSHVSPLDSFFSTSRFVENNNELQVRVFRDFRILA